MVRTQAHRQHLAALGGSPTGRKPPLVRTESPSPSGRKARKPQVDSQVLANEDVVVNAESENSAIVQATANNGDPATIGDPATTGPDDEDDYVTSSKQLPVIKKLKKQGRTIKPFSPQGNLCRLHRTLVFVM